jgi:hypothetical protein
VLDQVSWIFSVPEGLFLLSAWTVILLLFPHKVEGLDTFFERKQCSRHICISHPDLTDDILFASDLLLLLYFFFLGSGSVGASLAIFLGFTVSGIHLGFSTLSLQAAFC